MSDLNNRIVLVGSDDEISKQIIEFSEAHLPLEIKPVNIEYTEKAVIKASCKLSPAIVVVDFSDYQNQLEDIINEVKFIKKMSQCRSILFVALLNNGFGTKEMDNLFINGFSLAYYKANEIDVVLNDIFRIGFGLDIEEPKFAESSKIDKVLEVRIPSKLSQISSKEFLVKTDLGRGARTGSNQINLELAAFPELDINEFRVLSNYENSKESYFEHSINLELPVKGPWDLKDSKKIDQKDFRRWEVQNEALLIDQPHKIQVITSREDMFSAIYELSKCDQLGINIQNSFNEGVRFSLQLKNYPKLIFFDLDDEENSLEELSKLIRILQTKDFKPIVIVTSSMSHSFALQKTYNYPKIVAWKEKINSDLIDLMSKKFVNEGTAQNDSPSISNYIKTNLTIQNVDILHTINILKMTEHTIEFQSVNELPCYAILKFNLPVDYYVTIIPNPDGSQIEYKGIIHGATKESISILRKFIYQIIYEPLESFARDYVLSVISREKDLRKDIRPDQIEHYEKKSKTDKRDSINPNYSAQSEYVLTFSRPETKGSSKL